MEAALQLIANSLKCGYQLQAKRGFREASEKASAVFGSADERTVWGSHYNWARLSDPHDMG